MQKIIPFLWFEKGAVEAAEFYTTIFPDGKITEKRIMSGTPSGDVEIVSIELMGHEFTLMAAGPFFEFNPSISFLVACKTPEEVDVLWGKLAQGGKALMELGSYPFSDRYGWTQDKYGVSWQIMYMGDRPIRQNITPTLMFVGDVVGKAEEAIRFYATVFHQSNVDEMMRYGSDEAPDKEGTIKYAAFMIEGQEFAAMDSAHDHKFAFNGATSFEVRCETQKEIDHYWEKLSADPAAEQCGWLRDKYGVSWQIVPTVLAKLLSDKHPERVARVTEAFLKMKKFDIEKLEEAAEHT